MLADEFETVFNEQVARCSNVLIQKAGEYATHDRLHNFKQMAHLKKETIFESLAGVMAKHTVSIYDMCMSGKTFPPEVWDEKLGDHLNYLFLLRAIVEEETRENGHHSAV